MIRKSLTCFLILLLLNSPLFAQTKAEKKAAQEAAHCTDQSHDQGLWHRRGCVD